jgi:hypothetical protein
LPEIKFDVNLMDMFIPGRAFKNCEKAKLVSLKLSSQLTKIKDIGFSMNGFERSVDDYLERHGSKICYKNKNWNEMVSLFYRDLKIIRGDEGLTEENLSYLENAKEIKDNIRCTPKTNILLSKAIEQFSTALQYNDGPLCKTNGTAS